MFLPPKRSSWISRTNTARGDRAGMGGADEAQIFSDLDEPKVPSAAAADAPASPGERRAAPEASIEKIAADLTALLGPGKVSLRPDDLEVHSADKWYARNLPDLVVFAESTQDVSKTLRFASKLSIPVTTRGAGYGYVGGCVPVEGGIALSVARMKKIIEINPADGVAVVQPGVITGDLQAAAHAVGWDYPPDPASLKDCSIGGNVATNAGGPRCLKYGVTRHYVLGLEVVLADGRVLRCGGRVHKNKTGFDLCGLFTGSEGMLGVVTEATLRLIPKPPARAMLAAVFADFPAAATAVQRILNRGHLPSALEITDGFTLAAARRRLGPEALPEGEAHLMVEVDGRPAAVKSEIKELEVLLQDLGALRVDRATTAKACEDLWQLRREFSYSLRDTGLTKLNEDIVVPRSALVDLVAFARRLEEDTGIPVACFGHAGDGNIHVNLMVAGFEVPEVREKAEGALDQLFAWVLGHGGAITGEHGVGLAKKPWIRQALGDVSFDVHQAVKDALDPQGLLNPGKFLD
ncbi:FAD-binding oxidoreductase [Luteolibacter sp. Populi]|uniref:FAD-binding oxidoreductase n=1 Tax=Luteolibacter sp. Populi TaxID=3230487 RepID=UPI0034669597